MYWSIARMRRLERGAAREPAAVPTRYLRSACQKSNDASGITYTPVSFLLCADSRRSTTSGAHGASFQIVSCASL